MFQWISLSNETSTSCTKTSHPLNTKCSECFTSIETSIVLYVKNLYVRIEFTIYNENDILVV